MFTILMPLKVVFRPLKYIYIFHIYNIKLSLSNCIDSLFCVSSDLYQNNLRTYKHHTCIFYTCFQRTFWACHYWWRGWGRCHHSKPDRHELRQGGNNELGVNFGHLDGVWQKTGPLGGPKGCWCPHMQEVDQGSHRVVMYIWKLWSQLGPQAPKQPPLDGYTHAKCHCHCYHIFWHWRGKKWHTMGKYTSDRKKMKPDL